MYTARMSTDLASGYPRFPTKRVGVEAVRVGSIGDKLPWVVYVDGAMLRKSTGVGRLFGTRAAAERVGRMSRPTTEEQQLILDLLRLKARAGALGLNHTMHALESPLQIVGWEVAAKISQTPASKAVAASLATQADAVGLKRYAKELRRESQVGIPYRGPGR